MAAETRRRRSLLPRFQQSVREGLILFRLEYNSGFVGAARSTGGDAKGKNNAPPVQVLAHTSPAVCPSPGKQPLPR